MSKARAAAVILAVLGFSSVALADGTGELARARSLLARAGTLLDEAREEDMRLDALGRAVTAHEAALAALRAALRALAAEERAMTDRIDADAGRLAKLLAALQSISRAPSSALLAVRGGPLEATRAAMLMAGVTPELDRRVAELTGRLGTLRGLRAREEEARDAARDALAILQELRAATADALSRRDRAGLATRSALRDQAEEARERARDLDGLAGALASAGIGPAPTALPGRAPLPLAGEVTATFGQPDPWGRPGHGWSVSAPAFAQVTAPWEGTVRYAGPLIDYGEIVVLEPATGYLLVIAGLAHVEREAGEIVLAGEKLGDLGGGLPSKDEILREAAIGGSQFQRETVYLELRRSGEPLDPAEWFDRTTSEASR